MLNKNVGQLDQTVGGQDCGWSMMAGPWMMESGFSSGWSWFGGIFWFTTWILVILILIALLRWLWLKGNKEWK